MFKAIITASLMVVLSAGPSFAGHLHLEKFYQEKWCNEHSGVMEVRLPDLTRIDCLTEEYAIEFDFAAKWAESVGQALYYGMASGKRPGVVLIMEKEDDDRYLQRLNILAARYNIKVWTVQ